MQKFPHHYLTIASASEDSLITLSSENLADDAIIGPPPQFGGEKGHWSPEDLFCASISSCFILTFKSYTAIKKLQWRQLEVQANAELNKVDKKLCFTKVTIKATLEVCCEGSVDPYLEALQKAESQCLVTNSISSEIEFIPKIKLKAK